MPWRVEILNETVAAEIAALPVDMQARFLRLGERIAQAGFDSLGDRHAKHLEGKLWELRMSGRDGIARALRDGDWPKVCRRPRVREEDAKDAARGD